MITIAFYWNWEPVCYQWAMLTPIYLDIFDLLPSKKAPARAAIFLHEFYVSLMCALWKKYLKTIQVSFVTMQTYVQACIHWSKYTTYVLMIMLIMQYHMWASIWKYNRTKYTYFTTKIRDQVLRQFTLGTELAWMSKVDGCMHKSV